MSETGYQRQPTIAGNLVVFLCEDDLWSWTIGDRSARRITVGNAEHATPRLSPNGEQVAFVSREEGHPEVSVMPSEGGRAKRLTFLGGESCLVSTWTAAGDAIAFSCDAQSAFSRDNSGYLVKAEGGAPEPLGFGSLRAVSFGAPGAVIGRNADDPARWKRYRGGTAGDLWIDTEGKGEFHRLITVPGNPVSPMWIGNRIYFLSDHEGIGNIYSCSTVGSDLRRHTHEREYFARFPASDGRRLVYTAGGTLRILDIEADTVSAPTVRTPSNAPQTVRRFVEADAQLESFAPSPGGETLAVVTRGQVFTMPLWEEAVVHRAGGGMTRAREAVWLHDGKRIAYVSDSAGFERIEINALDGSEPKIIESDAIGRVTELAASPSADIVAFANHRHDLGLVDLESGEVRIIDRSPASRVGDLAFSPDGRYIAYASSFAEPPAVPNPDTSIIRVAKVKSGTIHDITPLLRSDRSPAWDPEGNYLYFVSTRDFNPVYDALQFDLSFPQAARPYVVTLRDDVASPFVRKAAPIYRDDKADDDDNDADEKASKKDDDKPKRVEIDFDGIAGRILAFPVEEGDYGQVVAAKGRAIFTKFPMRGIKPAARSWDDDERGGTLTAYDFEQQRSITMANDVDEICIGADNRTLVFTTSEEMRIIDATADTEHEDEPSREESSPTRKNGRLSLGRITVEVSPADEWRQMYFEAWRLQREQFWVEDMSQVDWALVRDRYARLLPLLRTRTELSDLIWEMQGELGTSHAYEIGGDLRRPPQYRRGFLGADFRFDEQTGGYAIERILRGDSWDREIDSPLAEPGLDLRPGDIILAIGDKRLGRTFVPDEALVHTAGREVALRVLRKKDERVVIVRTLRDERALRYRAWVEMHRRIVHERTNGAVGYLHIPDMGPWGFSEFHRGYLAEFNRSGLIVDVRHNRGGHVSPLLLEKLARKRVGYDISRYGPPIPYPPESVAGPLVALTDQFAGSDGDIFSHCFKLYGLGPLVGKRTWGGVIGINPYHQLIDGTVTTQPEFSFWFTDVGWSVENYGTDPDYDIDLAPQDMRDNRDPQLEKALELITQAIANHPPVPRDFTPRPSLRLPELP